MNQQTITFEQAMRPIREGEQDLIAEVSDKIKVNIGEESAAMFMQHHIVAPAIGINPVFQRVSINRWLRMIVLSYREIDDICVTGVISYIIDDGNDVDWLTLLDDLIIPFLREHNVIHRVHEHLLSIN